MELPTHRPRLTQLVILAVECSYVAVRLRPHTYGLPLLSLSIDALPPKWNRSHEDENNGTEFQSRSNEGFLGMRPPAPGCCRSKSGWIRNEILTIQLAARDR